MKFENLSGSVVEQVLDVNELLKADRTEIHALWQELTQQAVCALVRPALPRPVRVSEVDVDFQVGAQGCMQRHLRALVVGHDLAQARGTAFEPVLGAVEHVLCGVAVELDQHDIAADALDQCAEGQAVHSALDEGTLPMVRHDARGHVRQGQAEVCHVGHYTLADSAPGKDQPGLVALAQQANQLAAKRVARHCVDATVNRLVQHRHRFCQHHSQPRNRYLVRAGQFACNLLGRPFAAKAAQDSVPRRRLGVRSAACVVARRRQRAMPMKTNKIFTDNGSQSTDRFTGKTEQLSGRHAFDKRCAGLEIEHRLAPPRHL